VLKTSFVATLHAAVYQLQAVTLKVILVVEGPCEWLGPFGKWLIASGVLTLFLPTPRPLEELPCEKVGDACWKIGINLLEETNLGAARALFDS